MSVYRKFIVIVKRNYVLFISYNFGRYSFCECFQIELEKIEIGIEHNKKEK